MDIIISPPPALEVTPPPAPVGVPLEVSPEPLIVVPGPPVFTIAPAALIPPPADIAPPVHPVAVVSPAAVITLQIDAVSAQAMADFADLVNLDENALLPGMPVTSTGANGATPARCNQFALIEVVGLATEAIAPNTSGLIQTDGTLTLTVAQWAEITGQAGGLTPGETYYLAPFPGEMMTVPPATEGFYLTRIGRALSSTTLEISIMPPIGV